MSISEEAVTTDATDATAVLDDRRRLCDDRLVAIRERIAEFAPEEAKAHLCVYATGSFARREASMVATDAGTLRYLVV